MEETSRRVNQAGANRRQKGEIPYLYPKVH